MKIVNSPTAGWRTLRKLSVAAACVGLLTVSAPAVAGAALAPALSKPTVTSFKATPSHLSAAGGTVTLTAKVSGATTCTFSGHGTVTVSCSSGSAKVKDKIAANGSTKSKTIHLYLVVKGKGGTAPKKSLKVTEAGQPPPPRRRSLRLPRRAPTHLLPVPAHARSRSRRDRTTTTSSRSSSTTSPRAYSALTRRTVVVPPLRPNRSTR